MAPGREIPAPVRANRDSGRGLVATLSVLLYIGYGTAFALTAGAAVAVAAFLAAGVPPPSSPATMATVLGQPEYSTALMYFLLALPPAIYLVMPWAYFLFAALTKLVVVGEFAELERVKAQQPAGRAVRRFLLARIQDNILFLICLRQVQLTPPAMSSSAS